MIRISVTDLDNWRYYKSSEQTTEDFLKSLRHEEPPNAKMLAGRAFATILEKARRGLVEEIETATSHGITFRFAIDASLPVMPITETKGELAIDTPSGPVTLVGKVDALDGAIYDDKLTERFDAERYAESMQWRAYLTMFGGTRFVYNVFEGKEENGEYLVWGFHEFVLYPYDGMRADVIGEVVELADFIARNMPERVAA